MAERLLVVEDEVKLAGLLRDYLAQEGYEVATLHRGDQVEDWVRANGADLVLLDLMLPGKNGLEICKALRASTPDIAIIMVTARVEEIDRLLGLELGADDYICKPFSPREVVARVNAVLRRYRQGPDAAPAGTVLSLDATTYRAQLAGRNLGLTPVEFRLLSVLHGAQGRVFSREQLLNRIHDDQRAVNDRAVDSHIKNLRRKLVEGGGSDDWIKSIYGVGFRFEF
jgi:two-component system response regulator BaeR